MAKTFSSFSALKAAIEAEIKEALIEAVDESYIDAQANVDYFYDTPEGQYHRTGQLGASVESSVEGMHGEVGLDTTYVYSPSGRDTQTIYGYAESGGLLGNGGFWERTKEDVEKNIDIAFGKRFKRK